MITIKLQSNFIETALRHGFCPANLLDIFRSPHPENTSEWLFLILLFVINEFSPALNIVQHERQLLWHEFSYPIDSIGYYEFDLVRRGCFLWHFITNERQ